MLLNETVPQWVIDITVDVSVLHSCFALLFCPNTKEIKSSFRLYSLTLVKTRLPRGTLLSFPAVPKLQKKYW